ncbi:MAG TPA: hypothetical protein VH912_29565 [Streptosporangiaceae bacterium]|jgi:hypothetical protein
MTALPASGARTPPVTLGGPRTGDIAYHLGIRALLLAILGTLLTPAVRQPGPSNPRHRLIALTGRLALVWWAASP